MWLQIAVTDHSPITAFTANCEFPFRELFGALLVTPRNMPCLTCVTLMLYLCNNPSRVLHECSINECYIHVLFPSFPDFNSAHTCCSHYKRVNSVAVVKQSVVLNAKVNFAATNSLVCICTSFPLFSPFSLYIYCSPLKAVEHYVVLFLFFVTFGI